MSLVSEKYRSLLEETHSLHKWGTSGGHWCGLVFGRLVKHELVRPRVLDYGCGQGRLSRAWWRIDPVMQIQNYDPGRPEYAKPPTRADYTVCTDVLEHIEPECLNDVLKHIADLTRVEVLFNIALIPARQMLPDGRNAHLIVESAEWWITRLEWRFGGLWKTQILKQTPEELTLVMYRYEPQD